MQPLYESGNIINNRYRAIAILGRGGAAITYEAEDLQENRVVAIKILSLHQATEWKIIELFEREAKVLASLNHPQIPQYYDYFYLDLEKDRHFFLVQELVVGKSLKTLIEQGWYFQEADVKNIAVRVLKILSYLHDLKPSVIHRDIKPHNLIMTDDKEIYLVDFGSVGDIYRNTITRGTTFVGTIDYMSPEQIRGQASFASDLYSLGCTLLYLLTRKSPSELPIERMKIQFKNSLKVSSSFANWLDTILEPVAEDRFTSTTEALSRLETNKLDLDNTKLDSIAILRSKIQYKQNQNNLLIIIPPVGMSGDKLLEYFISLFGVYSVIMMFSIIARENLSNFFITSFLIGCLICLLPMIRNLLFSAFGKLELQITPNKLIIKWQLGTFQKQKILKTENIDRVKLQRENNRQSQQVISCCIIQEDNHEYKIGEYLTIA